MLRLSREADYSLLAMVYIAATPEGRLACRGDIAAHYNIPREFLGKVLQKLARHGLIESFRGVQGGYRLARRVEEISLADVIEAVDGPMALVECQRDPCDCPQEQLCTVQETLREVQQEIRRLLGTVTLRQLGRGVERAPRSSPRLLTVDTRPR